MVGYESFVLWIFDAFLDVECEWNCFEKIAAGELVVLFHIVEEGFFVA
jgi:hypothetical protein